MLVLVIPCSSQMIYNFSTNPPLKLSLLCDGYFIEIFVLKNKPKVNCKSNEFFFCSTRYYTSMSFTFVNCVLRQALSTIGLLPPVESYHSTFITFTVLVRRKTQPKTKKSKDILTLLLVSGIHTCLTEVIVCILYENYFWKCFTIVNDIAFNKKHVLHF